MAYLGVMEGLAQFHWLFRPLQWDMWQIQFGERSRASLRPPRGLTKSEAKFPDTGTMILLIDEPIVFVPQVYKVSGDVSTVNR
jgi:hypothetical protein